MKYLLKPLRELPRGLPKMGDRIEYIRCVTGYPVPAFAVKTGAAKNSIKKVLEGKTDPTLKLIQNILAIFPVNQEWLYLGTGDPFKVDDLSDYFFKKDEDRRADDYVDVEVNERLKEVRLDQDMSQPVFAAAVGTTKDILAFIETGRSGVTVPILKRVIKKFNVSDQWMLWGVGSKYKKKA